MATSVSTNNNRKRDIPVRIIVLIVAGLLAVLVSTAGKTFISNELVSQKISFGAAATMPDELKSYADRQVNDGYTAARYAQLIGVHVATATGGKSYSEVSQAASAAAKSGDKEQAAKLADLKRTALDGQNLRGNLLNVFAWWLVCEAAFAVGIWLLIEAAVKAHKRAQSSVRQ